MCVTPENRQSSWLHFEAGALAKHLDAAKVCPYLFGMGLVDLERPLAEFQAVLADETGTLRLVQALNETLGNDALPGPILEKAFSKHWPDLKALLEAIPSRIEDERPKRSERELLEEILAEMRALTARARATEKEAVLELVKKAFGTPVFRGAGASTGVDWSGLDEGGDDPEGSPRSD